MAQTIINTAEALQLCNPDATIPQDSVPNLIIQLVAASGICFDVTGDMMPLLTANDARKVAKWLNKAAELLDGTKTVKRKGQKKSHDWGDDLDEQY